MRRLEELHYTDSYNLNVDCDVRNTRSGRGCALTCARALPPGAPQHLMSYEDTQRLYRQLVAYPQEVVPIMDLVVNEEFARIRMELDAEQAEAEGGEVQRAPSDARVQVRPFNLREKQAMRDLGPSNIDQLVAIRGMVIRSTGVIPDLKVAHFVCTVCSSSLEVRP